MNSDRLGCLTRTGLIAGILTLLAIGATFLISGGSLFSPGPLNAQPGPELGGVTSHASTHGECQLCHAPFFGPQTMADRCLQCHTAIRDQQFDTTSLHGVLYQNHADLTCRTCHPEHRGPTAPLTEMDPSAFPHDRVGFSLVGHSTTAAGTPFQCTDCHLDSFITFDQNTCTTCHQRLDSVFTTTHSLAFGATCLNCHDGLDTFGDDFDHNNFPFPLTGLHLPLPCTDCHPNARTLPDLQAAPQDCYSCHSAADVHLGQYGTDCAACHSPLGWTPAGFDHNLSAFRLEGLHANVACQDCHLTTYVGTPTDCYSCHAADDTHLGSYGTNCAACHTPSGWLPATVNHNLFSFPLEGRHVGVACANCHLNNVFRGTPTNCYACHASDDTHLGRYGTDCASCHTVSGWLPATVDHDLFSFRLEGRHVGVACANCHINNVFRGTPTDCYACHAANDTHAGSFGTACASCHTVSGWLPASFSHTSFPLTNAHAGLPCTRCHTGGVYNGLSSACASCHAEPAYHAGLFSSSCDQCHTTNNWSASYNGSHPSSCDGQCIGHEGAGCRDCHTSTLASATCTNCHDSNNPGDGDD